MPGFLRISDEFKSAELNVEHGTLGGVVGAVLGGGAGAAAGHLLPNHYIDPADGKVKKRSRLVRGLLAGGLAGGGLGGLIGGSNLLAQKGDSKKDKNKGESTDNIYDALLFAGSGIRDLGVSALNNASQLPIYQRAGEILARLAGYSESK